jgi:hypothetical protein
VMPQQIYGDVSEMMSHQFNPEWTGDLLSVWCPGSEIVSHLDNYNELKCKFSVTAVCFTRRCEWKRSAARRANYGNRNRQWRIKKSQKCGCTSEGVVNSRSIEMAEVAVKMILRIRGNSYQQINVTLVVQYVLLTWWCKKKIKACLTTTSLVESKSTRYRNTNIVYLVQKTFNIRSPNTLCARSEVVHVHVT